MLCRSVIGIVLGAAAMIVAGCHDATDSENGAA